MIKLIEWLLGWRAEQMHQENREALEDLTFSREVRAHSERIGVTQRDRLKRNHVGEGFMLAFQAGQARRSAR